MDFTESLKLIQQTAVRAAEPKIIHPSTHARFVVLAHSDHFERVAIDPPPRNHELYSLEYVIDMAKRHKENNIALWHDITKVVLVFDDNDRRDVATMPLLWSSAWSFIASLAEGFHWRTQRDLVRTLRTLFGWTAANLGPFMRLQWENATVGISETQKGRDRLGREIRAEVTGTAELPDEITLTAPIYTNPGRRTTFSIRVSLDYDVPNQKIGLCAREEDISTALTAEQAAIHAELVGALEGVPVYYGKC